MTRVTRPAAVAAALASAALAAPSTARADLTELKWATEGYLRTRTMLLTNLAPQDRFTSTYPPAPDNDQTVVVPDIRQTSYIVSRFRLMPSLSYGKVAKLNFQLDGFDDVVWGDNNGVSAAPLFATDTSNQPLFGGEPGASINLKRAWMEFAVPVGLMRVGRMPSHWGMGLLANGGGTANLDPTTPVGEPPRKALDHFTSEDFGDKHFGSTADRILFITKPLAIYRTAKKIPKVDSNFILGYAFGKLSEAPLLPYEPFERKFRPFGQQGFLSRGGSDDVNEHVFLAVYNNPDFERVAYTDELRVGTYIVMRTAREGSTFPSDLDPTAGCGTFEGAPVPCVDTGSRVGIFDVWWRARVGPYFTEGEAYQILGSTFGGIPFPSRNVKKKASINAGVARVGYLTKAADGILELGHASGDDNLSDERFTQRPMHPDFNVGLILFEETLRELSARTYGIPFFSEQNPNGASSFFSNGGVINANYVNLRGRLRPDQLGAGSSALATGGKDGKLGLRSLIKGFELTGGLLVAFVDKLAVDGVAMFYEGAANDQGQTGGAKHLGTEVDLGVRTNFGGHMRFSLETGYLRFGKALKSRLTNADSSFTLQSSIAFVW
ncbi:MAG: hypothetical protein KBG28_26455 [Kofleriaceae bacterium]|nr:hypothetical protein [Kofleriaceae bacterium]